MNYIADSLVELCCHLLLSAVSPFISLYLLSWLRIHELAYFLGWLVTMEA